MEIENYEEEDLYKKWKELEKELEIL